MLEDLGHGGGAGDVAGESEDVRFGGEEFLPVGGGGLEPFQGFMGGEDRFAHLSVFFS